MVEIEVENSLLVAAPSAFFFHVKLRGRSVDTCDAKKDSVSLHCGTR